MAINHDQFFGCEPFQFEWREQPRKDVIGATRKILVLHNESTGWPNLIPIIEEEQSRSLLYLKLEGSRGYFEADAFDKIGLAVLEMADWIRENGRDFTELFRRHERLVRYAKAVAKRHNKRPEALVDFAVRHLNGRRRFDEAVRQLENLYKNKEKVNRLVKMRLDPHCKQLQDHIGHKYRSGKLIGEGVSCKVYELNPGSEKALVSMKIKSFSERGRSPDSGMRLESLKTHAYLRDKLEKLEVPHIIERYISSQLTPLGCFFAISMRYTMDLRHYIFAIEDKVKRTPLSKMIEALRKICEALRYMHEHKIIHGDVTPQNILIKGDLEKVVLTDFGNSNFEGERDYATAWQYAAPELFEAGDENPPAHPAIDMFSFGVICRDAASAYAGKKWSRCSKNQYLGNWARRFKQEEIESHLKEIRKKMNSLNKRKRKKGFSLSDIAAKVLIREPKKRASAKELLPLFPSGDKK